MAIKRNSNKIAYDIKHYVFSTEADLITDRKKLSTTYPESTAFITPEHYSDCIKIQVFLILNQKEEL